MIDSQKIRVISVDDHEILRSGIAFSLQAYNDLDLVGEADSGEDALKLCGDVQPDVALMDIQMPGMDGVQATQAIREHYPQVKVLTLSSFYDKNLVQQALQAGAVGYLIKGISAKELAEAIRIAHRGNTILSNEASQELVKPDNLSNDVRSGLTDREMEVLALLTEGCSNAEIAQQLNISVSTAKHHVRAILLKLDAANRAEAVSIALQNNLI